MRPRVLPFTSGYQSRLTPMLTWSDTPAGMFPAVCCPLLSRVWTLGAGEAVISAWARHGPCPRSLLTKQRLDVHNALCQGNHKYKMNHTCIFLDMPLTVTLLAVSKWSAHTYGRRRRPVSGANSTKHRRPYKMTKLTIVGGREAKTKSRALTGKQLCFVDQIVSGQSQTEAYKHCYNTSRMSAPTIHSRAYELRYSGADGEITVRIETELARLRDKKRLSHSKRYDLVCERLLEETNPDLREDSTQAGRVQALRALGSIQLDPTSTGSMFVERVSTETAERSSEDVMAELQRRLATLDK